MDTTKNEMEPSLLPSADQKTRHGEGSRRDIRRVVFGASVGTYVEYFDLAAYGFLAATISQVFFPAGNAAAALVSTFAVFGISFFARPLGGIFWGRLGDRLGRKKTLTLVIVVMSVSTLLIGLLPGYATIGFAAPVLLLLLRVVQGISAGGEISGAAAFVAEHSAEGERGRNTSWIQVGTVAAMLSGVMLAFFLTSTLSEAAMLSWGWRVPFLLAAPFGLIGLYIRNRMAETPKFVQLQKTVSTEESKPVKAMLTTGGRQYRLIATAVGVMVLNTVGFYILISYLPTYLTTQVGLERGESLISVGIAAVCLIILVPIMGAVSDRIGRRKTLMSASLLFMVLVYPAFLLMLQGNFMSATLGQILLTLPASAASAQLLASQTELFSTSVRYTGSAIATGLGAAIFGGSAPFVASALAAATGSNLVPVYMILAAAVIGLITAVVMKETAHTPLRADN